MTILTRAIRAAAVAASFALAAPVSAGEAKEQYFPLATFRVGAYASSCIPSWAGVIDYLRYINEVEGGINGVKLFWDECETEWAVEKGVECYETGEGRQERVAGGGLPTAWRPGLEGADREIGGRQDPADHHRLRPHRGHRRTGLPL